MLDPRAHEAQTLFWKIQQARIEGRGREPEVLDWLRQMSRLHEERARDLLAVDDADGWIDLFAAATAANEAGDARGARRLIDDGWDLLWDASGEARDNIEAQLVELERRIDPNRRTVPPPVPSGSALRDRNPFASQPGVAREAVR